MILPGMQPLVVDLVMETCAQVIHTAHQMNIVVVLMTDSVPQHVLDIRVTHMVIVPLDNVVIMTRNVKQKIVTLKVDVVGVLQSA